MNIKKELIPKTRELMESGGFDSIYCMNVEGGGRDRDISHNVKRS